MSDEIKSLINVLASDNDGIGFHMYKIWSGFTGRGMVTSHDSLISVICKEAYNKLADVKNFDFTIQKYLEEIETRLNQISSIIRNGIALQAAAASSIQDANALAVTAADELEKARAQTWALFPAMLRKVKPSYAASCVSSSKFWRFKLDNKDRYLCMDQPYRGTAVDRWGSDRRNSPGTMFRLSKELDQAHCMIRCRRGNDPVGWSGRHHSIVDRDDRGSEFWPYM